MASLTDRAYKVARRKVEKDGAPVTFTTSGGFPDDVYDETDDAEAALEAAIVGLKGVAIELPGDPEEYVALELLKAEPVTLFFVPDEIGNLPQMSDTAAWAGKVRTVQQIFPVRPAGIGVAAKVIMS